MCSAARVISGVMMNVPARKGINMKPKNLSRLLDLADMLKKYHDDVAESPFMMVPKWDFRCNSVVNPILEKYALTPEEIDIINARLNQIAEQKVNGLKFLLHAVYVSEELHRILHESESESTDISNN